MKFHRFGNFTFRIIKKSPTTSIHYSRIIIKRSFFFLTANKKRFLHIRNNIKGNLRLADNMFDMLVTLITFCSKFH